MLKAQNSQLGGVRIVATLTIALALLFWCLSQALAAGGAYDIAAYKALADADSTQGIPPGTTLSVENWQNYKQFLPIGLQWLYSGKYFYKLQPGPDYSIEVQATRSIAPPHQFALDTEKYAGQAKLKPLGEGRFGIEGYQAGLPFPNPANGPDAGMKVLYNFYYHYQPHVLYNLYNVWLMDRYNNRYVEASVEVFHRLMHVSDIGAPINNPMAGSYFMSVYDEVMSPEQSKYTAELVMFPEEVTAVQEIYVFLPSLRRSLRLSSTARCSPALGTDFTNDDNRDGFNGIPTTFSAELIGQKKVLALVHDDLQARQKPENYLTSGLAGWAKPVVGKWELRKAYLIDIRPLPEIARSYCYASRVLYVDQETSAPLFVDLYDSSLKPWKVTVNRFGTIPVNDGYNSVCLTPGDANPTIYDLQNDHNSLAFQQMVAAANSAVPVEYTNVQRYATPAGLSQVMK
jgi:Protein of unknown function (DUF1329)